MSVECFAAAHTVIKVTQKTDIIFTLIWVFVIPLWVL